MIKFSEKEVAIGKALLEGPMDEVELRKKTGVPADELVQALKKLMTLRIIELDGQKYKLVDRIIEQAGKTEANEKYRVRMSIEGASKSKEALEKQMNVLVDKLKQENIVIHELELADVHESEGMYSNFIEVEFGSPSFDRIIHVIINYGPSSIELLEPTKNVELSPREIHDSFMEVANFTHYYVGMTVNLSMQANVLRKELAKAKNELREKELELQKK